MYLVETGLRYRQRAEKGASAEGSKLEDLPAAPNPHRSLSSRSNLSQVFPSIAPSAHLFLLTSAQAPFTLLLDCILGFKLYLSGDFKKADISLLSGCYPESKEIYHLLVELQNRLTSQPWVHGSKALRTTPPYPPANSTPTSPPTLHPPTPAPSAFAPGLCSLPQCLPILCFPPSSACAPSHSNPASRRLIPH